VPKPENPSHFLSTLDRSVEQLNALTERALRIKHGEETPDFSGKAMALMFFNASVRTRVSFEAGLARFGGHGIHLQPGKDTWVFEHRDGLVMDGNTQEHVKEVAPVLSRFVDVVGIRKSDLITTSSATAEATGSWAEVREDAFMRAFARHADVPVVNMESNTEHPCQELADRLTLVEKIPEPRSKKYVLTYSWHPKSLPLATPHSQLLSASGLGMDVVLLRPEGWDLDPEVVEAARQRATSCGGSVTVTDDIEAAYDGAVAVCAKAWGSMDYYGRFEEEKVSKQAQRERWIVDSDKMSRTDDAVFLHCLPVRRGVVVSDGVLDHPRSAVIDEAENRLWAQMGLLAELLQE
jgi:N-acetylornithine carbamoyltransferase